MSKQINREAVAGIAVEEFRAAPPSDVPPDATKEIEPDWIEYFWSKAETVSEPEMQSMWARILKRKAEGHTVSLRTLDLLRTLSAEEAEIIQSLAQFKVAIGPDHPYWRHALGIILFPEVSFASDPSEAPERISVRGNQVVSRGKKVVDTRCRELVGHYFPNVLGPLGIYTDSTNYHRFGLNWGVDRLPVQIGDRSYFIEGFSPREDKELEFVEFGLGVGFSQIGWEIFSLAKVPPNSEVVSIFEEILSRRGLTLVERSID